MLTVDTLSDYTQGRLDADSDETAAILARSLAEVRRYCGWHVTGSITETITVDGPGGSLLQLPTLNLTTLGALSEDGVALTDLEWSADGLVRKPYMLPWSEKFRAIVVTITHGYADAPDFEAAVLSVADRKSQAPVSGGSVLEVGPFKWAEQKTAYSSSFTAAERAVLEQYRLDKRP